MTLQPFDISDFQVIILSFDMKLKAYRQEFSVPLVNSVKSYITFPKEISMGFYS